MFYFFLASAATSGEIRIYVSRHSGNDTKTCGKESFPCRTISYGLKQLSSGLYIYLDGTATSISPYTCEALEQGHPGIYLTRSVSFVSIRSRTYISCLHGNPWFVHGTKHKDSTRIGFSGLAFLNTSLRVFDAIVAVNDTIFAETERASVDILVVNLPRFELSFDHVVFKQNTACIAINAKSSDLYITITNTVFYLNGNPSSNTPSILWISSVNSLMNILLSHCKLKKDILTKNRMFVIENRFGTTHVLLKHLRFEENRDKNPILEQYGGVLRLVSARVFLRMEYGIIYNTFATFLYLTGQWAQIKISNIDVEDFYSAAPTGGVLNFIQIESCFLLIKNSSFRDVSNHGAGGVVLISSPNSTVTIQNSTFHNVSSFRSVKTK